METLRILIICKHFFPALNPRAIRATELAKEFSKMGHDVTVSFPTGGKDYAFFENEYLIKINNLGKIPNGVKLHGNGIKFTARKVLRRALTFIEYPDIILMFLVKRYLRRREGYDLLISIAVPHPIHWGVAKSWKKKFPAKVWVADCGDPYMFARLDTYSKPFFFSYLEKDFCRKCDFISVPFEEMRHQFYSEFRKKILVIPQGFNFDEPKISENPSNTKPTFIYAGSIIPRKRDLSLLLNFLSEYKESFLFIVYTKQNKLFNEYKILLKDKLDVRDYIDRKELLLEMKKADFLVNVDTVFDDHNNVEAVPSKLIDYAISGRPILNIKSDKLDSDNIKAFLSGDYSGKRQMDISRYHIKVVANQFIQTVKRS